MTSAVFFNLLANSTLSLLTGLVVVTFCLWLFRIETGRWKLFFLSLPFCKMLLDFAVGVPANSIQFSGIDPFALPPKSQTISIGAGTTFWGPRLNAVLSVRSADGEYAASLGDYLGLWLDRHFGAGVPLTIVAFLLLVSFVLLARRGRQIWRFEKSRRADRPFATTLKVALRARRPVDVYVSNSFHGSPFTGGFWKPYVCIPRAAFAALDPAELEAVVAHEMGHVRSFDLFGTLFVQTLGDFFWFVPGYRRLSRKIDRLRELLADQAAVQMGAKPAHLASALLKLRDLEEDSNHLALHSAFFRERSLLKTRIERLLGQHHEPSSRLGWQSRWLRWLVAFWIMIAALMSTFGGNRVDQIELRKDSYVRPFAWPKTRS